MTTGDSPKTSGRVRRRKVFVRPDLQLKVVFITLFVTSMSLIINSQLVTGALWQVSDQLTGNTSTFQVMKLLEQATLSSLFYTIVIAVPLTFVIGIAYSFRFAGPIVGIQNYLMSLRDGRWDRSCKVRKNDDLHDIADLLNECISPMRERIREDQATLLQVEHMLTNAVLEADETTRQTMDDILQRITASRDVVAERLPEQVEFVVTDPILSQKQMDEVSDPVVAEQKAPEHSA